MEQGESRVRIFGYSLSVMEPCRRKLCNGDLRACLESRQVESLSLTWCHQSILRRQIPTTVPQPGQGESTTANGEVRMSDHGSKEPSTLSFESQRTRLWILTSYLVVVILALPLWWSTTTIERLSLPVSRVDALSGKEVSLCVKWLFSTTI